MYNQMVVDQRPGIGLTDEEVDRIFHALADSTRRDILRRSLSGALSVSELAAAYDMSFAAVQKHVAVLEGAGLVTKEPEGRKRLVSGNPETIAKAQALMDAYEEIWRKRVERLDAVLADDWSKGSRNAHRISGQEDRGASHDGRRRLPRPRRAPLGRLRRPTAAGEVLGPGRVPGHLHPSRHVPGRALPVRHDGPQRRNLSRILGVRVDRPAQVVRGDRRIRQRRRDAEH